MSSCASNRILKWKSACLRPTDSDVMLWSIALHISPFLRWNSASFRVEVKTEVGRGEITLLWMRHFSCFCPTQPLFCFHSIPLACFKSPHLKANQKGWEAQACPEVEQSRVSFAVIAKFCDLNSGNLKKEYCSPCMTTWTKNYWIT